MTPKQSTEAHGFGKRGPPEKDVIDLDRGSVSLVPGPTREQLNEKQTVDYRDTRERFVTWLSTMGKNVERAEGYAFDVVRRRAHDVDKFLRWVWENQTEGYTREVTKEDANAYMRHLARSDYSATHKENIQKSVRSLFKWKDTQWQPEIRFTGDTSKAPRDYLTRSERKQLRAAALEYDSLPAYARLTPEERDRWKHYLSEKLDKPVNQVSPRDFEQADGFKYASMVTTALDTGLRPVEMGDARIHWVDIENSVLRITKEESAKNRENWVVSLQDSTAHILFHWLKERQVYGKYQDSDRLWLTRHRNPYSSNSLKVVLNTLLM